MKKNLFLLLGLLMSFNVMAQTKTITGTVVDATNEPVIGASVVEAGELQMVPLQTLMESFL